MQLFWTTQKRKINDLTSFDGNPRKMSDKQAADLLASLKKFNMVEIPAIDTHNRILAGHMRCAAMKQIGRGEEEIDVRVPSRDLTEDEAKEYLLRSNKNNGEWDFSKLINFGEDLLSQIGFDSKELDKIFKAKKSSKDDEAPEKRETSIKQGDRFKLGRHTIMCGDSTNQEDIAMLMDGNKADMVFTDPPYNVNYSGRGKDTSNTIMNDNQSEENFRLFLNKVFDNYNFAMRPGASMYVCYASRTHREFEDAINKAGFDVKNQIIWVKLVASMGWGDYRWKHEPILYCRRRNESSEFYGDRSEYTVWEEEKSDEDLLAMFKDMIKKDESGNSTVWRFGRESNYKHPTQKPVALVEKGVINSSKRGDIVLDMFGGSGSTLIACEKTSRDCRTMELDPQYIQVIIDRWEQFTGQKAEKI